MIRFRYKGNIFVGYIEKSKTEKTTADVSEKSGQTPGKAESIPKSNAKITVTPIDLLATHESFSITDPEHIGIILNAIKPENIKETEMIPPTGAAIRINAWTGQ